ncbi:MAG: hypothetical protein IJM57_04600 [Lachnospiraceae bacterium]|nr:hypothetical protein [Lachnospiraceae bacterium]
MSNYQKQSVMTYLFRVQLLALLAGIGRFAANIYADVVVYNKFDEVTEGDFTAFVSKTNMFANIFGNMGFFFTGMAIVALLRLRPLDDGFKMAVIFGAFYLAFILGGDIALQSDFTIAKLIVLIGIVVFGILYYRLYTGAMIDIRELQTAGVSESWKVFRRTVTQSYFVRSWFAVGIVLRLFSDNRTVKEKLSDSILFMTEYLVIELIVLIMEVRVLWKSKKVYDEQE